MKKYILPIIIVSVFVIPNLVFSNFTVQKENVPIQIIEDTSKSANVEASQHVLLVKDGAQILHVDLESYILGVLFGEMPADFELDALMAQAVATRTYTLYRVEHQQKHVDADLCTDSSCCQAYMTVTEYAASGAESEDIDKMREAVARTAGQVLTYNGKLIEATYFSCSGGRTEDAVDVWGQSVPYLKSVDSPGEETSRHYLKELAFTKQEFLSMLGLPTNAATNITVTYTEGGGVDTLWLGDHSFSGVQLRKLLSLPSTAFSLSLQENMVVLSVKGNGHRVGMSQYGSDAMAVSGKTYTEILSHYYQGTKLEVFTADQINAVFDKAGNL